jgi:cytochrome P450
VVGDVLVPAGTLVWNVMCSNSLDDTHFEQATSFKPERWLNDGTGATWLCWR